MCFLFWRQTLLLTCKNNEDGCNCDDKLQRSFEERHFFSSRAFSAAGKRCTDGACYSSTCESRQSGIHLVEKVLWGVDWKHTTTSWLNWKTKVRMFTKLIDDTGTESWRNKEIKPNQIEQGLDGKGYLLRVTYDNHANPKYSEVKRIISEVQGFKDNDFGKLEVGWFRLICNQCHYN